ncbi:GAF domain-containing protein [Methylobacterium komagatae]|uniref:GAF domain-containing protein n=1 Tax=Methylobacterium komagatae TaxID=374425 RepID=A0ABW2BSS9_9HYPH
MLLTTEYEDEQGVRLAAAAKLLSAARSVDEIVAGLRQTARDIIGSDGIAVVLRKGDLCHYVEEDAIEPLWRGAKFPMDECVSGWAMHHRRTVVIPDLETDPRVPQAAYARTSIRSLAMVPMGAPEAVAALGAYWCAYVEPDDSTVRRLEILAQVATIAFSRLSAPA